MEREIARLYSVIYLMLYFAYQLSPEQIGKLSTDIVIRTNKKVIKNRWNCDFVIGKLRAVLMLAADAVQDLHYLKF